MKTLHALTLLAALSSIRCGVAVAPMTDAATDQRADALSSTTVTFVATTPIAVDPSPVVAAMVHAETADGLAVEGITDSQGRVTLSLSSGRRWDVTFAHRDTQVVSIIGLRPEAIRGDIAVWMETLRERRPRGARGVPVYAGAPTRHIRLSLQPRATGTSASAGPSKVSAQYPLIEGTTADLAYQPIDQSGVDVLIMESEEEAIRGSFSLPRRMIHRRLEPTPQSDTDLSLDISTAVPVEPAMVVNVQLPTEGLITAALAQPFIGSAFGTIDAIERWSTIGAYPIGTTAVLPPSEQTPWRIRMIVASRALLRSDEFGPRYQATRPFGTIATADGTFSVSVRPDPAAPRDIAVPVLRRLAILGDTLADARIEAQGSYEQLGFDIWNTAVGAPSGALWVGWNFDPIDTEQPATTHVPRLPGGMTLGSLHGSADGPYVVNAVISTLPRSRPAYGFWRQAHETVRVVTQKRDVRP